MDKKKAVREAVRREAPEARRLAARIWQLAEPPFREEESAGLIAGYLAGCGFRVRRPIRSVPTAFKATRGDGRPAIGFLGEYDALPDCGLKKGTYGHACGHNLLGVGSAVAAVACARLLEAAERAGTVVYWGCPAEEILAGKVYMARDGAFRGLDACLAWHPGDRTAANAAGGSALDSLVLEFRGQTAHGAYADRGRSALDAAVLADVAVNYLREHVPDNVRIHSVFPEGGRAPNVVPEYAKAWYYVRGKDRAEVDDISRRVLLCARGAVMATETRLRVTKLTGVYNRLRSQSLAELVRDNLVLMGAPRATQSDRRRVQDLGKKLEFDQAVRRDVPDTPGKASSDEDNVSWLAPLTSFSMACVPKGVRGHNREYTAQSNLPFAHRGMLRAAEVLAAVAWNLATDAKSLRRVRAEFAKGTKGFRYGPLIAKGQRPPM
jgi:aminobenzoyl-glutamate utilization protein B